MLKVDNGEVAILHARIKVADCRVAGRWCLGELHFCFSYSSLSDCPMLFLVLELGITNLHEGVDEVVAFVRA